MMKFKMNVRPEIAPDAAACGGMVWKRRDLWHKASRRSRALYICWPAENVFFDFEVWLTATTIYVNELGPSEERAAARAAADQGKPKGTPDE